MCCIDEGDEDGACVAPVKKVKIEDDGDEDGDEMEMRKAKV